MDKSGRRLKRTAIVVFHCQKTLLLLFVTFDIILGKNLCDTKLKNFHSQVISQVPQRITRRNWHY